MKQAGFTLPEVLVGLTIGAVAVLIAGAGVAAALRSRAANLEASVAVEDTVATISLQNRLFARAVAVKADQRSQTPTAGAPQPLSARDVATQSALAARQQQQPKYLFEGDAAEVRFVTTLWGDPGAPGLWEVSVEFKPTSGTATRNRQRLVVAGHLYQSPTPGADDGANRQPVDQVLAEGEIGAGARFAYAKRDDKGGIDWKTSWKQEDGWPLLVSLDPDGDGPAPASVVSLPVEAQS